MAGKTMKKLASVRENNLNGMKVRWDSSGTTSVERTVFRLSNKRQEVHDIPSDVTISNILYPLVRKNSVFTKQTINVNLCT